MIFNDIDIMQYYTLCTLQTVHSYCAPGTLHSADIHDVHMPYAPSTPCTLRTDHHSQQIAHSSPLQSACRTLPYAYSRGLGPLGVGKRFSLSSSPIGIVSLRVLQQLTTEQHCSPILHLFSVPSTSHKGHFPRLLEVCTDLNRPRQWVVMAEQPHV